MAKEYAVGEIAVIRTGSALAEFPYEFAEVLAVGLSKIKTSKGDFATKSGKRWGQRGWYVDSLEDTDIAEAKDANKERVAEQYRRRLANEIDETKWRNVPLEKLEAIKRILDAGD